MKSKIYLLIYPAAVLLIIYLFFPIIAGMLQFSDCRGPKFYNADYHDVLYCIGYTGEGHPTSPVRKRSWFYGIRGEKYPKPEIEHLPDMGQKIVASFNQTRLPECLSYLQMRSGIKIEMIAEVSSIKDLYVEWNWNTCNEYQLREILDGILNFIKTEHNIDLGWKTEKDHIVIYKIK